MITTISSSNGDFQLSELLKTGLIFKSSEMNWKNAMEAAKKLGDGWRLPTFAEFKILQTETELISQYDMVFWSYDEYEENTECAYIWDISGILTGHWNKEESSFQAIAIRIL
jgi:hypothetical protein